MSAIFLIMTFVLRSADMPGWRRVGNDREHFDIALDRDVRHGGAGSGRLECNVKKTNGTGTLEQDFRPDEYFGKRIRVGAWIKGEDSGEALLFLRVDGHNGEVLDFDNTRSRNLHGTFDWQRRELVLDVSEKAAAIQFGLLLLGKGKAWLDDVSIEIVPRSVKRTASAPVQRVNPRRAGLFIDHPALNLDFEQ